MTGVPNLGEGEAAAVPAPSSLGPAAPSLSTSRGGAQ